MEKKTQNWHHLITAQNRRVLTWKIVRSVIPRLNEQIAKNVKVRQFVAFARRLESTAFSKARSRNEYYSMLSRRIYSMHSQFIERRRLKLLRRQLTFAEIPIPQQQKSHYDEGPNSQKMNVVQEPWTRSPSSSASADQQFQYLNNNNNNDKAADVMPGPTSTSQFKNIKLPSIPIESETVLLQPDKPFVVNEESSKRNEAWRSLLRDKLSGQSLRINLQLVIPHQMIKSTHVLGQSCMPSNQHHINSAGLTASPVSQSGIKRPSDAEDNERIKKMAKVSEGFQGSDNEHTSTAVENGQLIGLTGKNELLETNKSMVMPVLSTESSPETVTSIVEQVKGRPSTGACTLTSWSQVLRPSSSSGLLNPKFLRRVLMQVYWKIQGHKPESQPFQQPVDLKSLKVPNYHKAMSVSPMDLTTLRKKMDKDDYMADPWNFIDDMWSIFENAWLLNNKSSRVFRCGIKLSEVFTETIDPIMKSLGYCCGIRHSFQPQPLMCIGQDPLICSIGHDAKYFLYSNNTVQYCICEKCFNGLKKDTITLSNPSNIPSPEFVVKKEEFVEQKNNEVALELFVSCNDCGRKFHRICVLHFDVISPKGFVCDTCLKGKGKRRRSNKFRAKHLSTTNLSSHVETRVNDFLTKKNQETRVIVRILSCSEKSVEVKPEMKKRYVESGKFPESFPYKQKVLYAFQEIDGVDVAFFAMHVQEYGSECPAPNTRRLYIAYLDSVNFFTPREFRTDVYHEIILGYLEYAKKLGFGMAHIWACPPLVGNDYIFYCHPPHQKFPKAKRLQDWYKKLLDKGVIDGIVLEYKDIHQQSGEENISFATQIPYFEGDFWPDTIETAIQNLAKQELKRKIDSKQKETESNGTEEGEKRKPKRTSKSTKKKDKKSGEIGSSNTEKSVFDGDELSEKIRNSMKQHKQLFFVVRLQSHQELLSLPPIEDSDPLMTCSFIEGRDSFLALAREQHYEFSSLRRAKYSTLGLMYDLHNEFVITCDECKNKLEDMKYTCTVCDEFDLCRNCFEKSGHPHKMDLSIIEVEDEYEDIPESKTKNKSTQTAVDFQKAQELMRQLSHAAGCKNNLCTLRHCLKMKKVIQHGKICHTKNTGECGICQQIVGLCSYHSRLCQLDNCSAFLCKQIKRRLVMEQPTEIIETSFCSER